MRSEGQGGDEGQQAHHQPPPHDGQPTRLPAPGQPGRGLGTVDDTQEDERDKHGREVHPGGGQTMAARAQHRPEHEHGERRDQRLESGAQAEGGGVGDEGRHPRRQHRCQNEAPRDRRRRDHGAEPVPRGVEVGDARVPGAPSGDAVGGRGRLDDPAHHQDEADPLPKIGPVGITQTKDSD